MQWLYSQWAYCTILFVSLLGLALADRRWKLVAWNKPPVSKQATLSTLAILAGFFLIWDIAGILFGIFHTNPRFTLGLNIITPNLPIEEIFFLCLLVYSCLLIDASVRRWLAKREQPRA